MSEAPTWDDLGPHTPAETARLVHLDRDLPLGRDERPNPLDSMRRRVRSRSYRAALPRERRGLHDGDRSVVLDRAAHAAAAVTAAQVEQLQAAIDWAALHTAATHGDPAQGGEQLVALAGDGAPLVAELAVAELALALGVTTDSGRLLMTDALELAHRLPGCWSALLAGGIAVFKARRVARATLDLPAEAAAFVDAEVAPYLHAIGVKALDEVVAQAIWAFDLPRALAESAAELDRREITIDLDVPGGGADGARPARSGATSTAPTPSSSRPRSPPWPTTCSSPGPPRPSTSAAPRPSACSPDARPPWRCPTCPPGPRTAERRATSGTRSRPSRPP